MQAAPRDTSAEVALAESFQNVGILDAEGRFMYCGQACVALLGNPPARLVGASFPGLLSVADQQRVLRVLAELRRSPAARQLRVTVSEPTESAFACRLASMDGGAEGVVALELRRELEPQSSSETRTDEERDSALLALKQKTAEREAILRALPDLFFRFDAEGRFLDFSAPTGATLYAPPSFFLGKRPHEVMPPGLAADMERTRVESQATHSLATLEYELEVDGKREHWEARYVPHLGGETIALSRNVTSQREAEAALRASEARLRESQKLDAVGRLAGGVAHDFNNLLMIILGYTAAVARHVHGNHPAASALDEIGKAVDRATALTKQLLALSRRQPIQPTILDLGTILNEMGSMLSRVIGEQIVFSTEVAPGLARLHADRSQIEQVLLNLVLNARDAMPRGGRLSIRAENAPAFAQECGRFISLSVSDTGEGMDAETKGRIFEPFFTTKPRGTGLGLFTVHHVVTEYGGTIEVASEPGQGTQISVRLPAVEQDAELVVAERRGTMVGGDETVLVVEDEDPVRMLLVDVLEQLGYEVLAAANAEEALDASAVHPREVSLLLTDVVMPGVSGWELAKKVRNDNPRCSVLYMSGHALSADERAGACVVGGDLLQKPFTPSALAKRVRKLLDQRGS